MKRQNEHLQQGQYQNGESGSSKKPRYTPGAYGNVYSQFGMMAPYPQGNPFRQSMHAGYPTASYTQPSGSIFNMGYGDAQSMMVQQYNAAYSQGYPTVGYNQPAVQVMGQPSGGTIRTIYLGNITEEITAHDVLKNVRHGTVEYYRVCPEKNCAFLGFVESASAEAFMQEYLTKKLIIKEKEIKLGWGKVTMMNNATKMQITGGATRNVYLGRLSICDTEESIRNELGKYGPIEHIKVLRDKHIAFVHFCSLAAAVKCVSVLIKDPAWKDKKVNYGKDHCAAQAEVNLFGFATQPQAVSASYGNSFDHYSITHQQQQQQMLAPGTNVLRTLYLGNVHPEATTEDLCNVIRGGNLLQIRFFPDKHIAFVTFLDAATALMVFNHSQTVGIVVRGRKLRVGWGKPSTISGPISQAILQGATRNIYIGGIPESLTVEQIKKDFAEFGDIELVNTMKDKMCAFVNFTRIADAITAINAMKLRPEYADYKLNFGKDRCGNSFKPVQPKKEVKKEEVAINIKSEEKNNEPKKHADIKVEVNNVVETKGE